MNKVLGNRIKKLRKQRGWSQEETSFKLNISQATYARMEKGETTSWAAHLEKLSEVFNISPDELVKKEATFINHLEHNKGQVYNADTINFLSEKIVEQYEKRIIEKDELILELRKQIL